MGPVSVQLHMLGVRYTKSCFFIGHRDAPARIKESLEKAVEELICEHDVKEFIVGNHGNFDCIVQTVLSAAKKKKPEIRLLLLTAYHPAVRQVVLPEGFDCAYYPPGIEDAPLRFAIVRANRTVVDTVDYLIAFVWHPGSAARDLLEYAERRKLVKIHNIANEFEVYRTK